MRLTVFIHHEVSEYWSEIAELPGCFASGRTLTELHEALSRVQRPGDESEALRSGRVPKNTRELGSPMATCSRRCLRPCSDCSTRSMTFNNSLGGQGSVRELISIGPNGVTATSLTETSCSPR